jgi:putative ABC transport system permease protein
MPRTMFLAVRTSGDPKSALGSIRSQVQALDSDLPVYEEKTMGQLISTAVAQPRLNLILMAVFAVAALVLAAVGIYGVISYSVTQRTHEIGIRMALGASSSDVLGMIIRQGMALSAGGIALGLVGAFWGTGLLSSLLYGISATDPVTFIVISAILAGVALTACFIPAQRATRVDPMIAPDTRPLEVNDGYDSARHTLWRAGVDEEARVHGRGGSSAWAGHRRDDGYIQRF